MASRRERLPPATWSDMTMTADCPDVPPTLNPEYLTPAQAASLLPRRRRGKKPAVATLYRWFSPGVNGVTLRYAQIGGTRCTTREWLQDFFDALTAASLGDAAPAAPPSPTPLGSRTSSARQRDLARAEREAESLGV